jgi:hypothetical protein
MMLLGVIKYNGDSEQMLHLTIQKYTLRENTNNRDRTGNGSFKQQIISDEVKKTSPGRGQRFSETMQ